MFYWRKFDKSENNWFFQIPQLFSWNLGRKSGFLTSKKRRMHYYVRWKKGLTAKSSGALFPWKISFSHSATTACEHSQPKELAQPAKIDLFCVVFLEDQALPNRIFPSPIFCPPFKDERRSEMAVVGSEGWELKTTTFWKLFQNEWPRD